MLPFIFLLLLTLTFLSGASQPQPRVTEIDGDLDISKINEGLHLFEGDIKKTVTKTRKRRSISAARTLWPLPVPYSLYLSLDMNAQGVILKAFEQFRLKTCIDFRPQQFWFEQHIALKWGIGCWSEVGRQPSWAQDLSIGPNCDTVATVEHELMHALGFWHEQSRYDRDNYVSINWENIKAGEENNFEVGTNYTNSTMGTPYDYLSIMHYPKDAFTNGNGSTIITKLPEFQDVIGQRLDMSHYDIEELNRMYECNESISFLDHFSFDEGMREMSSAGWQRVSRADGGPHSDHTYLGTDSQGTGFFMHFSTKRGSVGDSARLQTRRMTPRRSCKIQCLEFFYYHSGSWSDQLNIWIREFDDVDDIIGTRRLMSQIQGSPADYWQLHHVPLNATKTFQVEFEARKGAGASRGGFSVDDINLSETECPHHTWQIRNFEEELNTSPNNSFLFSPKYYSTDGYRYQVMVRLNKDYFGVFVRLVSGINDDWLQWPCPWRQVTFTLLDQNPHIQKRMSQQRSVTTSTALSLREFFGNPRISGSPEDVYFWTSYVNNGRGYEPFMPAAKLGSREFLKGGDIFLLITMQDISPLRNLSSLPCPSMKGKTFSVSPLRQTDDDGPCGTQHSSTPTLMSTTYTPTTTTSTTSTPTTTTSTTSTPITTTSTTYTPITTTSTTYTPTTTSSTTSTPTTATSTPTTTTSTTYTPTTATSRTTASTTYTPITTTSRTTASTLRPYRVTMQTTTSTSGKSTSIDSLNASLSTIRAGNVSTTDSPPVTPPDRCDNIFSVTCYKIEISPGALVLVTLLVFIWGMLCKPCCCKKKRSVPSAENMVFMQMQEN